MPRVPPLWKWRGVRSPGTDIDIDIETDTGTGTGTGTGQSVSQRAVSGCDFAAVVGLIRRVVDDGDLPLRRGAQVCGVERQPGEGDATQHVADDGGELVPDEEVRDR